MADFCRMQNVLLSLGGVHMFRVDIFVTPRYDAFAMSLIHRRRRHKNEFWTTSFKATILTLDDPFLSRRPPLCRPKTRPFNKSAIDLPLELPVRPSHALRYGLLWPARAPPGPPV